MIFKIVNTIDSEKVIIVSNREALIGHDLCIKKRKNPTIFIMTLLLL